MCGTKIYCVSKNDTREIMGWLWVEKKIDKKIVTNVDVEVFTSHGKSAKTTPKEKKTLTKTRRFALPVANTGRNYVMYYKC